MALMEKDILFKPQMQEKTHKELDGGKKVLVFCMFAILVVALFYINFQAKGFFNLSLGIYGSVMVMYLLGKMLLSFIYKPATGEAPNMKVTVIIPSYNESADAVLGTIQSVLSQDYPIHEIFFIDDGSKDTSGFKAVQEFKQKLSITEPFTNLIVHRLPQNKGKRHAQIWAFEHATGDVMVTVDSDCTVFPNAVRELLKPFNDEKVMATTGHVNVRNRTDNLLTRLIDMRYDNAFRVERAAHSVTHNVLVCSGPLSAYRREVIMDNIEHYGSQTFLGELVQFGDDRCLTNYAIRKGKTIYQSTAKCITDAPTTLRQFIKQQARWNKSFFRESLIAWKIGFTKPHVFIWVTLEMSLWIMFGISLLIAVLASSITMLWVFLAYYLAYISISAYVRNVFYAVKLPLTFLLAPAYGIIHIVFLLPLRFYSLVTIKSNGWGTR